MAYLGVHDASTRLELLECIVGSSGSSREAFVFLLQGAIWLFSPSAHKFEGIRQ